MKTHGRDLQINEDPAFQRREWLVQRIGRVALLLFVIAALLGFTGFGGPFARGEAGTPGGPIHLEYERVVRRQGEAALVLHLRGGTRATQFWISDQYMQSLSIDSISPEPQLVSVADGRVVYSIAGTSSDVAVVMRVEHQTAGIVSGEIGLIDGPSLRFRQVSLY